MEHEQSNFELDGWVEEDFSDLTNPEKLERDPWEIRLVDTEDKADFPNRQVQVAASFEEQAALLQSAPYELVGIQDPVEPGSGPDSYGGEFTSQETEYVTEVVSFPEWDDEPFDRDEPNDLFFIDGNSYDDPENDVIPLADYDSDLGQALYELAARPRNG